MCVGRSTEECAPALFVAQERRLGWCDVAASTYTTLLCTASCRRRREAREGMHDETAREWRERVCVERRCPALHVRWCVELEWIDF